MFEAREGSFGDARVGENDRDLCAVGLAEEIRPDFGFHDDYERGLNRAEGAAHRDDPVERKVEDAVGGLQAFAGQALAGFGGGGDENRRRWDSGVSGRRLMAGRLELRRRKRRGSRWGRCSWRLRLCNRCGCGADGDFRGQTSEAFAESARWFAGTPTAQREIRREEEHACRGENAIEKIHSVGVAHSEPGKRLCRARTRYYSGSREKTRTTSGARRHRTAG